MDAKPNLEIGTYSASESYVKQNPAVIRAFRVAAAQTALYITDHPDEYRAALPAIAKLDPGLANKVNLPVWRPQVDLDSLQFFADRMVQDNLVTSSPDVTAAVAA